MVGKIYSKGPTDSPCGRWSCWRCLENMCFSVGKSENAFTSNNACCVVNVILFYLKLFYASVLLCLHVIVGEGNRRYKESNPLMITNFFPDSSLRGKIYQCNTDSGENWKRRRIVWLFQGNKCFCLHIQDNSD